MKSVLAVSWEIRSTSFLKIILNNICIYTYLIIFFQIQSNSNIFRDADEDDLWHPPPSPKAAVASSSAKFLTCQTSPSAAG